MSTRPRDVDRPLWRCPRCGRPFANRNQEHACVVRSVADVLAGKPPRGVALYRAFARFVRRAGPVIVTAAKTRIAFQARMIFAAVNRIGREHVTAHLVFDRRVESPRFHRIDSLGPTCHVHHLRIASLDELDDELLAWVREAHAVGRQERLRDREGARRTGRDARRTAR